MLFRFVLALVLIDASIGQYEYPNYEDETSANTPEAYPDYGTNPQPNPEPQYPDYSEVETVATTTTTLPPRTNPPKRPQVFPPTPTDRRARRPTVNRIVHWYILNGQGYPIRTAISRRYRSRSQANWLPPYYRSLISGARSARPNANAGGQTQRVQYVWFT